MLGVVSDLTGYPVEMISLDMDIEADLGIDSIKRVEILSAFEEKMPHLPQVSPELMGTMKTLGQIVQYLVGTGPSGDTPQPSSTPEPSRITAPAVESKPSADSGTAAAADPGRIEAALLAVVSDLTGYPVEMISPDMDIEADLGIDSIKRVEILSAFEEKMPELPPVSPEVMGSLKTLSQIVNLIVGTPAVAAGGCFRGGTGGDRPRESGPLRRCIADRVDACGGGQRADRLSGGDDLAGYGYRGGPGHRLHQAGRDSFGLRGKNAPSARRCPRKSWEPSRRLGRLSPI